MTPRPLTVAELVAAPGLGTTVLAGRDGLGREVLWAHSCEMADPAAWLGPHELLMTVGLCVPADAEGQVALVARLDDAGLAGLMIGDHAPAPPLTGALLAEADRRGFPVLLAAARTPYAAVARHVAAANSFGQLHQVLRLSKLYHLAAHAGDDDSALTDALATLLDVGITVADTATGTTLLASGPPPGAAPTARRYPLRGHHDAELRLRELPGAELDSFLLVHLMKVMEVAVDRVLNAADRRSELSAAALAALLGGTVPAGLAEVLRPHRLTEGFRLVAVGAGDGAAVARLAAVHRLPVAVGPGRSGHLALVPAAAFADFRSLVRPVAGRAGVSSVYSHPADVPHAAAEAGRALAEDGRTGSGWAEFEGTTVSVLARSRREAEQITASVLGGLCEDGPRAARLRETLFAYLRNDRAWAGTAAELGIHRQTLAYRLGQITEETGLDLAATGDLSSAWIAYQAWESLRTE
ncbi:PucR family transcriptional regulator ligand-binding domain-containing protein [Streptomyces sp. NPDC004610]|uniref:PucR family transcriptional regulator ligand-binding domain-containing protein n=1 Tax=unclassified Streptomyces TaxID=2593676 RepID=UPI0033B6D12D